MRVNIVVTFCAVLAVAEGSRTVHFRCRAPGQIAVTFDDGPSGNDTESALRALEENNVPGTFFLNARQIRPSYSKRDENIRAARKLALSPLATLAHHTYDHVNALTQKWSSFDQYYEEQIERETQEFEEAIGFDAMETMLRPPFLAYNETMFENLRRTRGMVTVGASLNPRDWDLKLSMNDVIERLVGPLSAANPKYDSFISLHHPKIRGAEESYQYLDYYFKYAKQAGFEFVTVKKCLGLE